MTTVRMCSNMSVNHDAHSYTDKIRSYGIEQNGRPSVHLKDQIISNQWYSVKHPAGQSDTGFSLE